MAGTSDSNAASGNACANAARLRGAPRRRYPTSPRTPGPVASTAANWNLTKRLKRSFRVGGHSLPPYALTKLFCVSSGYSKSCCQVAQPKSSARPLLAYPKHLRRMVTAHPRRKMPNSSIGK